MVLSRRQLLTGAVVLPVTASVLNACGGGSSGGGTGGSTGAASSGSSSSSATLAYTGGTEVELINASYSVSHYSVQRSAAGLTNGNFVAVWQNNTDDIKAQIYTGSAAKVGSELDVSPATYHTSREPNVAALSGGGFVVVWVGEFAEIQAQIFTASGAKVGLPFALSSSGGLGAGSPLVAGLTTGGFVVTWMSGSTKCQAFSSTGTKTGSENMVAATTSAYYSVSGLTGGGYVVVWEQLYAPGVVGRDSEIMGQLFDANHTKLGSNFQLNTTATDGQIQPSVAGLVGGGFVAAWADNSGTLGDSASWSVKAQRFTAAGAKAGSEFLVNTRTAGFQISPSVAALNDGSFIISWLDSFQDQNNPNDTIRAQLYTSAGAATGAEFIVSSVLKVMNGNNVAALPTGGFVVNWTEFSGPLVNPGITYAYKARPYH